MGPLADVMNYAEFCCCGLMGFDSVKGQNSPSPIDMAGQKKRSKVKEIIVLIKARSFLDELNLEHLTS